MSVSIHTGSGRDWATHTSQFFHYVGPRDLTQNVRLGAGWTLRGGEDYNCVCPEFSETFCNIFLSNTSDPHPYPQPIGEGRDNKSQENYVVVHAFNPRIGRQRQVDL